MPQNDPEPQARVPLSRERVLRAASDVADVRGLDALTMRGLGQTLGVEAMSLYNHVANKDDLLDGMIDIAAGEIDLAGDGDGWRAKVVDVASSAHGTLIRHPWLAQLWLSHPRPGPARLAYMEHILGSLRAGGFSPVLTHHAFHVVENHVFGHALQAVAFAFSPEELPAAAAAFLEDFPAEQYPAVAEHIQVHIDGTGDGVEDSFAVGLDLILDSLERLLPSTD